MEITEFEYLDPERVDAVFGPANGVDFLLLKSLEGEEEDPGDGMVKFVSAAARRKFAESGVAMPDGSFPIADEGHLKSAIGRLGNYKGNRGRAKRHIIRRAKALHATHLLPDDWQGKAKKALTDTQGSVQGRELAGSPSDSLGQTRENGDDEIISGDVQNDAGKPQLGKYNMKHPDEHTGYGDTAPNKALPETEALSQTREEEATKNSIGPNQASSEGTVAPNRKQDTAEAEHEAQTQTMENHEGESEVDPSQDQMTLEAAQTQKGKKHISMTNPDSGKGKEDTDPGNPAWQEKDVSLAAEAVAHLREALSLAAQFESREKREAKKAAKRINAAVRSFSAVSTVAKEIEDMTTEELLKLLDDRDQAKAQKAQKAAKKEAKRAAKATAKVTKAAETSDDATELAKRVMELESAPVRRAAMNDHADLGARPVFRGAPAGGLDTLQKALDSAHTPQERMAIHQEMIKAKFLGNNNIQVPQDENGNALPHGPVALISQPESAFANARAAMGRR